MNIAHGVGGQTLTFFRPQVNGENSYDAVAGGGQNFGNPYDCPEGMYGGSMVSSVGYSKVSDYSGVPQFRGPAMAPQQPPMPPQHAMGPGAQAMQNSFPGDTGTVIYKGGPEPQPIIQGVPGVQQQQQQPMQPQPMQVQMPPQTQVSIPNVSRVVLQTTYIPKAFRFVSFAYTMTN